MNVKRSDVHRAFDIAAKNIKDTADINSRISNTSVRIKLAALGGVERDLTDMFVRMADNFDRPLTVKDVDAVLKAAKETLVDAYDLDNNGLSDDEVARMPRVAQLAVELARVLAANSPDPVDDGISDVDRETMVELACSPTFGADAKLTRRIGLVEVPAAVRREFEKSAAEFAARSVAGVMGYSARIEGYYAIYKSETDHRVVGYAIYGVGDGEPDYHDGMVNAFDVRGKCVYSAESNDRDNSPAPIGVDDDFGRSIYDR
ncbi:MAG: hypothetical protein JXR83_04745 [Deltaproteobacteria bacterium]|nr:hypothetical protein [Deltaproteobacteria bacterium]